MKRFALAITAALAAALSPASALAADLPSRYAPAPYYDQVPVFSWTGFYAGVNGQFGVGSYTSGGSSVFGNPIGGLGGATVGYNYQSGKLLIGAEADIGFGSISSSNTFGPRANGTGTINTLGTARVRAGYVWNQAVLYLTGGYAGTGLNGKVSDFSRAPGLLLSESHYLNGYAVGGGIEYAVTTKVSLKGEYIFTGFNSERYFPGTRGSLSSGANVNLIRLGVNYHF